MREAINENTKNHKNHTAEELKSFVKNSPRTGGWYLLELARRYESGGYSHTKKCKNCNNQGCENNVKIALEKTPQNLQKAINWYFDAAKIGNGKGLESEIAFASLSKISNTKSEKQGFAMLRACYKIT